MNTAISIWLLIACLVLAWKLMRAIYAGWVDARGQPAPGMFNFWYSPCQDRVISHFNEVHIDGWGRRYSECGTGSKPFGRWKDYRYVGQARRRDISSIKAPHYGRKAP